MSSLSGRLSHDCRSFSDGHLPGFAAFTLVQVIIAIAILAILLIPASTIFLSSTRTIGKGDAILEAHIVGQSIIDSIKDETFIQANLGKTIVLPDPAYPSLIVPEHFVKKWKGKVTLLIQVAPDQPSPDLRQIEVRLEWEEKGVRKESTMTTFLANLEDVRYFKIE